MSRGRLTSNKKSHTKDGKLKSMNKSGKRKSKIQDQKFNEDEDVKGILCGLPRELGSDKLLNKLRRKAKEVKRKKRNGSLAWDQKKSSHHDLPKAGFSRSDQTVEDEEDEDKEEGKEEEQKE